jgi:hypothetical protein
MSVVILNIGRPSIMLSSDRLLTRRNAYSEKISKICFDKICLNE